MVVFPKKVTYLDNFKAIEVFFFCPKFFICDTITPVACLLLLNKQLRKFYKLQVENVEDVEGVAPNSPFFFKSKTGETHERFIRRKSPI